MCVCVCVWVGRGVGGGGARGVRGVCPLRVYVILRIYLNYGLCLVHLFYECEKMDVLFIYLIEPLIVTLNCPVKDA